jgi:hypothetical protein
MLATSPDAASWDRGALPHPVVGGFQTLHKREYDMHRFTWSKAVVLVLAGALSAQVGTSLSGVVTDPSDAVVPGALVTLTSKATRAVRTTTADATGAYMFAQLAPGGYSVKVERQGFQTLQVEEVAVLVSTANKLDLRFAAVGALAESVQVTTAATAAINTVDATIGNAFHNRQVVDLPLSARNVVNLLSLQPGVVFTGANDAVNGSVNGGRSDQANVTLDGVDVNEQQLGTAFFSVLRTTPDALQEFRVTTTNTNADQGRASGAQVALVTKSGGNAFHGSLYEYHRNTVTTANDWFNNKSRVDRPALLRNNFGGSLGGPVRRDKMFFFFNYEGFREAKATTIVREAPLPTLGQGIVRYRSANGASDPACPSGTPAGVTCLNLTQIGAAYRTANGVDPGNNPAALAILASAAGRYSVNDTTQGDGLNSGGFRFNAPVPVRTNTAIAKFDFNLTNNQNAFVRLNYQNDTEIEAPTAIRGQRFPDTPAPAIWTHPRGLAAAHTWTIGPSLVNSLRYGLTRHAFSQQGDSAQNSFTFRFIYQPRNDTRTLSRVTPVHNIVDDLAWTKGTHTIQAGTNLRLISNQRDSFAAAYDSHVINPTFYASSGDVLVLDANGRAIFPNVATGAQADVRDAVAALIGRYSEYAANFNFAGDGALLPVGASSRRDFRTQEYEFYGQDTWRVTPHLTLTYGLRWNTSVPVYEASGLEVKPNESLGRLFEHRVAAAYTGRPFNELVTLDKSGKVNGRSGLFYQDWNNFGPSAALAWNPSFRDGLLGKLFGDRKTTIRGGYRMIYDQLGQAVAVFFDLNNTLGFSSSSEISANTYNVTTRLGPLVGTGNDNVRAFPRIVVPGRLTFPLSQDADESTRIEASLDDSLVTPRNHSLAFSIGRDLGKNYSLEVGYVGRFARDLLTQRDAMHFNNLRDPRSGMDWYTAMRQLSELRLTNAPITAIAAIPYFENILPGLAGTYTVQGQRVNLTATQAAYRRIARTAVGGQNSTDYTFAQEVWDDGLGYGDNLFIHPQYAALSAYSSIGRSDFNSLQVLLRKRFSSGHAFDVNYTYGHSLDDGSALQRSGAFLGIQLNPLNPRLSRSHSDFDIRHNINANYIVEAPFGRGKAWLKNMNAFGEAVLGGWQTTGIFRWNTGLPAPRTVDLGGWVTNYQLRSSGVATRKVESSPTRTGDPNLFSNPTEAYRSFRTPFAGEAGDRNTYRYPGYVTFDFGLYKSFRLFTENQKLTFRWEVFNLTNTQRFTGLTSTALAKDPNLGAPSADFGKFTGTQGTPRVMQFALRIDF